MVTEVFDANYRIKENNGWHFSGGTNFSENIKLD